MLPQWVLPARQCLKQSHNVLTVRHCSKPYYSFQSVPTLFDTLQQCFKLSNSVYHLPTVFISFQQCLTLSSSVLNLPTALKIL